MTALSATGQFSLSAPPRAYPYAQIKGDSLEFVFSYSQEKKLRELNEFRKNCYNYVDNLNKQISFRDSLIRELYDIKNIYKEKEEEHKREKKLSNDKYRTLQDKTVQLQDLNTKLTVQLKDEEIAKNKWKTRTIGLVATIVVGTVFTIML